MSQRVRLDNVIIRLKPRRGSRMSFGTRSVAVLLIVSVIIGAVAISDGSCAETGFSITDSTNMEFSYSSCSEKIIVTGYAVTSTLIQAGMKDKIYAVDQYGAKAFTDNGLDRPSNVWELNTNNTKGFEEKVIEASENGSFDKNTDTVALSIFKSALVGDSGNGGLRKSLMDEGFRLVPFFGAQNTYDSIVNGVRNLESITGSDHRLSDGMVETYNTVVNAVGSAQNVDAVYVRYSETKGWSVCQSNSVASMLIETAGGNYICPTSMTEPAYGKNAIIEILANHPSAVIFIDNTYFEKPVYGTFDKFVEEVLDGIRKYHSLVKMETTWNNYGADVAVGLETIAHLLHPDLVEGELEPYHYPNDVSSPNIIFLACVLSAGLAVTIIGLFVRSRRTDSLYELK